MNLQSGFVIELERLTPYYLDYLDLAYPFRDYPMRDVTLTAGDTYQIPYEPDEDALYDASHPDYALYIRYKATEAYNAKLEQIRQRVRVDFLLSTCVRIVSGPYDMHDAEWKSRMEGAFQDNGWRLPTHEGELRLLFIKSIIRTEAERAAILHQCLYEEVSEQNMYHALNMFQSQV